MQKLSFESVLEEILDEDDRYDEQAYLFIREALDHTMQVRMEKKTGQKRHVTGQELLSGIRVYALAEFGPLAFTVLKKWGIHTTEDFGHIVFNLVNKGILGKTEEDSLEDFCDGYSFDEAFRAPFLPKPTTSLPLRGV